MIESKPSISKNVDSINISITNLIKIIEEHQIKIDAVTAQMDALSNKFNDLMEIL